MKRMVILAAVSALVVARPETYQEKEDFQYSRSSTDEGSKSGFYGAQRGNMGGNYEHAHNMDSLAQNQMSGLVRQTEGELGDGVKTRTGSVFSSANTRGIYGSGHYDLSNLAGRNFQEGVSYGDAQSSSQVASAYNNAASQTSSAYNNAASQTSSAYNNAASQMSSAYNGRYTGRNTAHSWQSGDAQAGRDTKGLDAYDYERQNSQSSGYNTKTGYQSRNEYQQSAYDLSNANSHLHSGMIAIPVRVVVRPGGRVAVPIAAQTYDSNQRYDQNSINSEAEELSNSDQNLVFRPKNNGKHYESSYNYTKQWEKHYSLPTTGSMITTQKPLPVNGELYDSNQALTSDSQHGTRRSDSQGYSSNSYNSGFNTDASSSSSQSGYHTGYNTQHKSISVSNSNAYTRAGYNAGSGAGYDAGYNAGSGAGHNAGSGAGHNAGSGAGYNAGTGAGYNAGSSAQYNAGSNIDLNSQVENINNQPKSYESSYSYHKSWERQGDPYVIKPASSGYTDSQSSQRYAGRKTAYGSSSHQSQIDCDELCGHVRQARSYDNAQYQEQQSQNLEDMGQQSQNLDDLGQQSQNFEDLGQQSQNLEDLGQQSQNFEDLGQQSQNIEDLGQQSQNLEDLGQLSQNSEDLGQQTQNLDNLGQQSQATWDSYKDLGQQTQNNWNQQLNKNTWETAEDLAQQTRNVPELQTPGAWAIWDRRSQNNNQQNQNTVPEFFPEQTKQTDSYYVHPMGSYGATINDNTDRNSRINNFWNQFIQNEQHNSWSFNSSSHYSHVKPYWDQALNTQKESSEDTGRNPSSTSNAFPNWNGNPHQVGSGQTSALSNFWSKFDSIEKKLEAASNRTVNDYNSSDNNIDSLYDFSEQKHENQERPQDVGRGDIGPEDFPNQTERISENSDTNNRLSTYVPVTIEKDTDKIESLNNEPSKHDFINAFSINQQKAEKSESPQILDLKNEKVEQPNLQELGGPNENFTQQNENTEQNIEGFEQQSGNFEQNLQTFDQQNEQQSGNFEQNLQDFGQQAGNYEQNLQTFDQQNGNVEQQNVQELRGTNENFEQNLQTFTQQNENTEQNLQGFEQQSGNFEQNLQTFDQQNEQQSGNFEQNLQDFGQQAGNYEQNLQTFNQQNGNVEQQNVQELGGTNANFEQNLQTFTQQNENTEQNLQGFEQQSGNFEQNLQDFGQQAGNYEQNLQTFDQQNGVEQQNVQELGGTKENFEQNLQTFTQQNENTEQNLQGFEQQSGHFEQNLQDFGQQVGYYERNLQTFDPQNENMEQQNVQELGGPNENFEQNLQTFSQQNENTEQNIQGFEQQSGNFEQNLQDFGQQVGNNERKLQTFDPQNENVKQQNVQDLGWSNANFEQNLQPFSDQNKNVEKQNTYNTGQQARNLVGEQNIQDFQQQGRILEQNEEIQSNSDPKEHRVPYSYDPKPVKMEVLPISKPSSLPEGSSIEVAPEPVTEKPGFWKSVGNKFVNAKDKVTSWFSSG